MGLPLRRQFHASAFQAAPPSSPSQKRKGKEGTTRPLLLRPYPRYPRVGSEPTAEELIFALNAGSSPRVMAILSSFLSRTGRFAELMADVPRGTPLHQLLTDIERSWAAPFTPFLPYFGVEMGDFYEQPLAAAIRSRVFLSSWVETPSRIRLLPYCKLPKSWKGVASESRRRRRAAEGRAASPSA